MIPDAATLGLFVAAALALLLVPGPAVLYIVARSIDQGRSAGLVSVLGVHLGSLVHVTAAAVGLSSLLVSSAVAFGVVKYAGAAYLILLGVRRLLARETGEPEPEPTGPASAARLYWHGVVVNVLNPKTALFVLAFLPQFVDPDAGPVAPQMLVLGTMLVALGVLSDGTYALVAARAGRGLRAMARRRRLERLSGGVFVGLGVVAALAGEPQHD
jgi:threonine/homoserine/homoserine lactone efflux protein